LLRVNTETHAPRSVRLRAELDARWHELQLPRGAGGAILNLAVELLFQRIDDGDRIEWMATGPSARPVLVKAGLRKVSLTTQPETAPAAKRRAKAS
jgi:hypothetical protein